MKILNGLIKISRIIIWKTELLVETLFLLIFNAKNIIFFIKISLVLKVEQNKTLSFLEEHKMYDFSVCNPPFFGDETEAAGKSEKIRNPSKRHKANSINTAQLDESVYDQGGEVEFIKKMIDESDSIGNRIR